jgi:hypothetical protein
MRFATAHHVRVGIGFFILSLLVFLPTFATEDNRSPGVALVEITLTGTDYLGNAVNLSTTTAKDGSYSFGDVLIDDGNGYTLTTTAPSSSATNYTPTTPVSRTIFIPRENTHILESFGYLVCTDADEDGFSVEGNACGEADCNDANTSIHPGAPELPDTLDNDCDGVVDESDIDPLLLKHAPILHIFADDFRPKEVGAMIDKSDLFEFSQFGGRISLGQSTATLLANPNRKTTDFMDLQGASPDFFPEVPDVSNFDVYTTAIYGRSFIANSGVGNVTHLSGLSDNTDYRVLQYWFFYPYNDFFYESIHGEREKGNHHEGDWEMIQLILDNNENPLKATYSWHWGGTTFDWPNDLLLVDNDHPRVFVGDGGHASWNQGGVNFFRFTSAGQVVNISDQFVARGDITPEIGSASGVLLYPQLSNCTGTCETYDLLSIPSGDRSSIDDWNSFPGLWGSPSIAAGASGPRSPSKVIYGSAPRRWTDPIAWSNDPTPAGWDATAHSPVNLSVTDSEGNRVGTLPNGEIQTDIPGTYYFSASDDGPEWATIFTDDDLTFILEGTGTGTMDFSISRFGPDRAEPIQMNFKDVPLTPTFIGFVHSKNSAPEAVMHIDSDGDGTIDGLYLQGAFPTLESVIDALPDEAFEKRSKDKQAEKERRKLQKQAEKAEKEIQKGHYEHALKQLEKLRKNSEKKLVDVEAEAGESTKTDLLALIHSLKNTLSPLAEEEKEKNKGKKYDDEDEQDDKKDEEERYPLSYLPAFLYYLY